MHRDGDLLLVTVVSLFSSRCPCLPRCRSYTRGSVRTSRDSRIAPPALTRHLPSLRPPTRRLPSLRPLTPSLPPPVRRFPSFPPAEVRVGVSPSFTVTSGDHNYLRVLYKRFATTGSRRFTGTVFVHLRPCPYTHCTDSDQAQDSSEDLVGLSTSGSTVHFGRDGKRVSSFDADSHKGRRPGPSPLGSCR